MQKSAIHLSLPVFAGVLGLVVAATACGGSDTGSTTGTDGTVSTGGGTSLGGGTGGVAASGGATSTSTSTSTVAALTWSQIYAKYFATGTAGHCVDCHSSFGASASALYTHLKNAGQISGTSSPLVTSRSILLWSGGNMPQDGTGTDAAAVADLKAWVAAGALNN
jgi:hypothetical protein